MDQVNQGSKDGNLNKILDKKNKPHASYLLKGIAWSTSVCAVCEIAT